jgi:hypothetical protein
MTGMIKLTAAIAVILVAGLATLLVFEVIPAEVFSAGVKKVILVGIIFALTAGALAFIIRPGK